MGEEKKQLVAETKEKGNSAVISALIAGIACLGIGIAVGMFLPNDATPAASDCVTEQKDEPEVGRTAMDSETKKVIDAKLNQFEKSSAVGLDHLRPFHWKELTAQERIHAAFYTMYDSDLADFVAAQKSWVGGDPIVKTVPIDRLKEVYKNLFGEEPVEDDFVSYLICGSLSGRFDYDKDNNQYKISYTAGCGGYYSEPVDSYRDVYEVKGNSAYVTVEIGSVKMYEKGYMMSDYKGGDIIGEYEDDPDFVNESTKDKFTKYQYIFDKHDDEWVLRGLYPLGAE